MVLNKWWGSAGAAAVLVTALVLGCSDVRVPPADVVMSHGEIVSMDAQDRHYEAIAIRDGRIAFLGSNADAARWIGGKTQVVNLGGRMLMPGFIDAHLHALAGGRALLVCDLAYAPLSQAQLKAKLQACLDSSAAKEPDGWLEAVNWDRASTSAIDGDPTKALLDSLPTQRPIAITSSDFHSVLANSRALALAGITAATPDPSGGHFAHAADGTPSGICEDAAGWQLKAAIPPDSDADLLNQGRAALAAMRAQGITSFMDAAAGEAQAQVFKRLQANGELTARVNLALQVSPGDAAADPVKTIATVKSLATSIDQGAPAVAPGINARIIKLFMDGVVNAPADTAALLSPYFTNTGTDAAPNWQPGTNAGNVYYPSAVLGPVLLAAADAQLDVHAHATGERAVREVLDAVAQVRSQRPKADFRPAIAHDETVAVADYPRFKALDVMATMSFQWAQRASYSVGETEHHLGPDRFARMEPSGSLALAGARIVHGSDWPIDPFDTFLALKVGVTRSGDPANPNSAASLSPDYVGRINDDPALSRVAVLRAITANAAHQLRLEQAVGTLEVGKLADLIVLDQNFLTVPEDTLGRNRVLLTMVGGQVVMGTGDFASLVSTAQQARNGQAQIRSLKGSVGHAVLLKGQGGPHSDGHMH